MAYSLPEMCRLCANISKQLMEIKMDGETIELAYNIEQYLHIEIHELAGYCFRICRPCKTNIEQWHRFFQQVLEAQARFDPLNSASCEYLAENLQEKTKNDAIDKNCEIAGVDLNGIVAAEMDQLKLSSETSTTSDLTTSDKENNSELKTADQTSSDNGPDTGQLCSEIDRSEMESENDSQDRNQLVKSAAWQCHVCSYVLSSWRAVVKHCNKQHNTSPQYHCVCGEVLYSRDSITKHYLKHEKGFQFKCDKCNKSFHRKHLLEVHALSHLPKDQQPWICETCDRRFHSKNLLKQHKLRHLPLERKVIFPCEFCDKRFCSKSAAAAHARNIHFKEKPFVCHQCGLKFASKGILDEHLIVHSNVFDFQCKDCGKLFKTKYRLRVHADTHLQTRYSCPICDLTLNTRRTLRMHLLVHKDQKDFNCETCGKGFKRSKDLKNHRNLHTGLKPYSCQFCNRTFANGPNCRSHKLRMHGEELKKLELASEVHPEIVEESENGQRDAENKIVESRQYEDDLQTIMSSEEMTDCLDLQYHQLNDINFSPPHLVGFSDGSPFAKEQ